MEGYLLLHFLNNLRKLESKIKQIAYLLRVFHEFQNVILAQFFALGSRLAAQEGVEVWCFGNLNLRIRAYL